MIPALAPPIPAVSRYVPVVENLPLNGGESITDPFE